MLRTALATAALLVSAAATPPAYAAAPRTSGDGPVVTDERGCTEVAYIRGALREVIRPLVPERFELSTFPPPGWDPPPAGSPDRVNLLINEVVCDVAVTRAGAAEPQRQREVTTIIVSAQTETIDGQPSDGSYALLFATENKTQANAMQRLGWPVTRLSRRGEGSVTTTPGGLMQARIVLRGAGWDSGLTAASVMPFPEPTVSTAVHYRDTGSAQLKLCFDNEASQVGATYTGDLSQTPLATLTSAKPVFAGYPGSLIRGGWRSTLTTGSCP